MSNFSLQFLKIETIVSYLLQIQNIKHKITNTVQPSKVTLAGESAGSFSSFYHLSSPTRFYSIIIHCLDLLILQWRTFPEADRAKWGEWRSFAFI